MLNIEKKFGRHLFIQSKSGFLPHSDISDFFQDLHHGLKLISRSIESLNNDTDGYIRISVPPVFARNWLLPRLHKFYFEQPDIRFSFDASREVVDVAERGYHCAIRYGHGDWQDVEAVKLMDQLLFPVCRPALREKISSIEGLADANIITCDGLADHWVNWLDANGAQHVRLRKKFMLSDEDLCLGAAIGGLGVTVTWQTQAIEAMKSAQLVSPLPMTLVSGRSYWLVTPREKKLPPALRQFHTWLSEEAKTTMEDLMQLLRTSQAETV
ncbi:LysR substrate-binding domain-containing protein [Breoghania sp.]|uniref:LysR substrate-binding domain-containing protein n=1 Tax=Breoghania sp. TaxID=2065378 RepID=UPI00261D9784|nr:LysR substrate-binding domain-containing protein [Breoghania sp.]MDJ0933553.1 LysR substrate-binding domain-containing protein [Breoghania sp.]